MEDKTESGEVFNFTMDYTGMSVIGVGGLAVREFGFDAMGNENIHFKVNRVERV